MCLSNVEPTELPYYIGSYSQVVNTLKVFTVDAIGAVIAQECML